MSGTKGGCIVEAAKLRTSDTGAESDLRSLASAEVLMAEEGLLMGSRLGDEGREQVAKNTGNKAVSPKVVPPVVPWGVEWDAASAELTAIWIDLGESERNDLLAVARGLAGPKAIRRP